MTKMKQLYSGNLMGNSRLLADTGSHEALLLSAELLTSSPSLPNSTSPVPLPVDAGVEIVLEQLDCRLC